MSRPPSTGFRPADAATASSPTTVLADTYTSAAGTVVKYGASASAASAPVTAYSTASLRH